MRVRLNATCHRSLPNLSSARAMIVPALGTILLSTLLLTGCKHHQWTYSPPAAPTPSKDFDVHYDANHQDPNGAPRNIDWEAQLQGRIPDPDACNDGQPYSSVCTQNKLLMDSPDILKAGICVFGPLANGGFKPFFGHADWTVAQYDGSVGWLNFNQFDRDYGLMLVPESLQGAGGQHGITKNNGHVDDPKQPPQYMEIEMDSDETDGTFSAPSSFWAQFKDAAQSENGAKVQALLHPGDPKTLACGTVLGLFGLDCDHGCRSELHPIYALAIQRTEDADDNEWSVLVRNWGTGGFCSEYNDEVAATSLSLVLPYSSSQPPTSVEVQDFVTTADSGSGVSCPSIYFQDTQTILNFTLPTPESRAIAAFTLKVSWPSQAHAAGCPKVPVAEARAMEFAAEGRPSPPVTGEDYMEALLRGISPGTRLDFEKDILPKVPASQARLNALRPTIVVSSKQSCNGPLIVKAGRPQTPAVAPVHKLQKDLHKRERDRAMLTYVCQQYRTRNLAPPVGTQQDLDRACHGVK